MHPGNSIWGFVRPSVDPSVGPSVRRSVRWSVRPSVMLLSAGRDEPANDLFHVYKLVFLYFIFPMKRIRRCAYQTNPFWVPWGTPKYPQGMILMQKCWYSTNVNFIMRHSGPQLNLGPDLAISCPNLFILGSHLAIFGPILAILDWSIEVKLRKKIVSYPRPE